MLNSLIDTVRAGRADGVPDLYLTGNPGAVDTQCDDYGLRFCRDLLGSKVPEMAERCDRHARYRFGDG